MTILNLKKTSTASQTIPEKKTKISKAQETQTKSENIAVERQDKPTQTTVTKE